MTTRMKVEIKATGQAPYGVGELLDSGTATTERGIMRIANRTNHRTDYSVHVDGKRQMIGVHGRRTVAIVCEW